MKGRYHYVRDSHTIGRVALLLVFWMFGVTSSVSAAVLQSGLVVGQIGVLEDAARTATLDQILAQADRFTELQTTAPNYNLTTSAYWFRIPVQNQVAEPTTYYLDIKNTNLDYATLFVVSDGQLRATVTSGAQIAMRLRPYAATTLVLPFQLEPTASVTLYLRTYSVGTPLFVPLSIEDEQALQRSVHMNLALNSAIAGLLGGLLIYNLFIFLLLWSRLYLYYVLFLLTAYVNMIGVAGFGRTFLFPDNVWLWTQGTGVFFGLSLVFMILFTREFLQTRHHRWLDRVMIFFVGSGVVTSIGVFFWPLRFGVQLTIILLLVYPLTCLLAGVIAWRRGNRAARWYLIGQGASWFGMMLFALLSAGVLPYAYHIFLYESPMLGLASDALLLSLALADRIRALQQAQIAAEDQARRNLEIRGEELERLVAARTAEIKTLHGILPICANCKKIRTEEGAWQALESYISQHTDAQFSHGICTDCMAELYPEIYRKRQPSAATQNIE